MKNSQTSNFPIEKKELNNNTNFTQINQTPRITKEIKYNETREKLDKLNYKLHFDISDLQIIDLMANDIFSYKTQIENLKKNSENLKESNDRNLLNVAAFKKENIKLIKENNELIKQNIELGKNLHNSNTGKSIEIKRLQEEKSDFKFMLSNSKIKIETLGQENSQLRNKLNSLLSKIYDTNFNDNNLKTLFDKENNVNNSDKNFRRIEDDENKGTINDLRRKSDFDTFSPNDISDLKMGIYVKQRNIKMTSNLDIGNNSLNRISENKDFLKKVLNDTFAKRQNQERKHLQNEESNNDNINSLSETNQNQQSLVQNPLINNFNYNNNTFDYKKFKENQDKLNKENLNNLNKINILEKELKEKNKEIARLTNLCRNESSPNNEILIKYLKEEKESLTEKYEKRTDFLIRENKKLEEINLSSAERIKIFDNQYPYVAELELKAEELIKKNKIILNNSADLENKLTKALKELENLNEKLKHYKENSIPKNKVLESEINYKKLLDEYTANQNLMKNLDEKVKESAANNNSTKNILFTEIKEIKMKLENLSSEKINLNEEIKNNKKNKEDLLDKINLLNMNLLKKDNEIRDTNEKMENLQKEFEEILIEKNKVEENSEEMKQKLNFLQCEILNKNDEIFRLNSLKNLIDKGNSMTMKGK